MQDFEKRVGLPPQQSDFRALPLWAKRHLDSGSLHVISPVLNDIPGWDCPDPLSNPSFRRELISCTNSDLCRPRLNPLAFSREPHVAYGTRDC